MDNYFGGSDKNCMPTENGGRFYPPAEAGKGKRISVNGSMSETNAFHAPLVQMTFDNEEMQGSMQQILAQNIGEYVVVEFLIGTERMMRKQGILYFVGRSYVTLYDDDQNNYIVCDLFSIKFVYFYYPGARPRRNYNVLPSSNSGGNSGRL